jgi:hypothetical protein
MKRYLRARLDPEIPPRVSVLAEAAGVSRVSLWRWHQRVEFENWLDLEERAATLGALTAVHQAVYRRAMDGDLRAARLFLQRFDPDWPGGGMSRRHSQQRPERPAVSLDEAARLLIEAGFEIRRRA